jgi:hypothetical protein
VSIVLSFQSFARGEKYFSCAGAKNLERFTNLRVIFCAKCKRTFSGTLEHWDFGILERSVVILGDWIYYYWNIQDGGY